MTNRMQFINILSSRPTENNELIDRTNAEVIYYLLIMLHWKYLQPPSVL